jgi:hypothetical protein
MPDKKLLRVTLVFEDIIQTLEGEYAEKWLKAINDIIGLHQLRGNVSSDLPEIHKHWKIEKRTSEPEPLNEELDILE